MPSNNNHPSNAGNFFQSNLFTAILVGLFVVELVAISTYTYSEVQSRLEPKNLVDEAEKAIVKNYPEIREKLTEEVKAKSPAIAKALSEKAIATAPEVRQWAENATRRQLNYTLDEATKLSTEEFRDLLQANREKIKRAFVQIEDAPEETKEYALGLESSIDEYWGINLKNQTHNALEFQQRLNDKLERLSSDAPLEPKELLEQRIVRILKTLEQERLPKLKTLETSKLLPNAS
ncbi:hypothetical protein [Blastopirellula marina]|uniref:Uncharacterized protein n=1 Tax=Blastopirellula marina TaxID=124 RepID=A0A2S8GPS4_9BACT|nr:hypothetical protein [Blastopirellula marina]PQO46429.1 hypothetical protein C5Y93_08070 [Blastopirellula marina]